MGPLGPRNKSTLHNVINVIIIIPYVRISDRHIYVVCIVYRLKKDLIASIYLSISGFDRCFQAVCLLLIVCFLYLLLMF